MIFFVSSVHVRSSELRYVPRRHWEHAFKSGVDHKDTLTWAVRLNLSLVADDDVEHVAATVAADTGLVNHGRIGSLDGYYVFSHLSGISASQVSFSSSSLRTVSRDEHRWIQDQVHRALDQHPFVEWYMQQQVIPRVVRSSKQHHRKSSSSSSTPSSHPNLHFNDPFYHKQWHLVGIGFREFVCLSYPVTVFTTIFFR